MKVLELFAGTRCISKVFEKRGSQTGTQGLKDSKSRSLIPELLCEHIVDICESIINE